MVTAKEMTAVARRAVVSVKGMPAVRLQLSMSNMELYLLLGSHRFVTETAFSCVATVPLRH